MPVAAEARAGELAEQIRYHRERYYNDDEPEIADAEFDELVRELEHARSTQYPELDTARLARSARSARRVGATFAPVRHVARMLSLDNVFDRDELLAWHERIERDDHGSRALRGRAQARRPRDLAALRATARCVQAATRGDGEVGEDVTANVGTIGVDPAAARRGSAARARSRCAARSSCRSRRSRS